MYVMFLLPFVIETQIQMNGIYYKYIINFTIRRTANNMTSLKECVSVRRAK